MRSSDKTYAAQDLQKIIRHAENKSHGRKIVVWGKGQIESSVSETLAHVGGGIDASFYVSNDADVVPTWRGKPVYKFKDINLSPDVHYVIIFAESRYQEIRDTLVNLRFTEFKDFWDVQHKFQVDRENLPNSELACSICGNNVFVANNSYPLFNSSIPRRCVSCGSQESQRTIPDFFDSIHYNFFDKKI